MKQYDITIIGGGLVGYSLAYALSQQNLDIKIALIEKTEKTPSDARSIALTYGSYYFLSSLGLDLEQYCTPIKSIHVSEQGRFGSARIHADSQKVPALGYVIWIQDLLKSLQTAVSNTKNIEFICPAQLTHLENNILTLDSNQKIQTKLLIAADGTHSMVRQLLKIQTITKSYDQHAIVANITLNRSHQNFAYERFTKDGSVAFLPLSDNQSALVWALPKIKVDELLKLPKQEFLKKLQKSFGYRLGKFINMTDPARFPLVFQQAKEISKNNVILIGNASQSLHPIAAQGFNLGLRDTARLVKLIKQNTKDLPQAYQKSRFLDQSYTCLFTDGLVRSNSLVRQLGLNILEQSHILKKIFSKRAMGFGSLV